MIFLNCTTPHLSFPPIKRIEMGVSVSMALPVLLMVIINYFLYIQSVNNYGNIHSCKTDGYASTMHCGYSFSRGSIIRKRTIKTFDSSFLDIALPVYFG